MTANLTRRCAVLMGIVLAAGVAGLAGQTSGTSEMFTQANELVRDNRLGEAKKVYARIARLRHEQDDGFRARMQLAALLRLEGKDFESFGEYQIVADYSPALRAQANMCQLDICAARMSRESADGSHPGPPSDKRLKNMLETVLASGLDDAVSSRVLYYLGLFYEQRGRIEVAKVYYRLAADHGPGEEWYDRSFFGAARIVFRDCRSMPNAVERARQARDILHSYVQNEDTMLYKDTARHMLEKMTRRVHQLDYAQARFYDKDRYSFEVRLTAYRNFLAAHPDAPESEEARRRIEELVNAGAMKQAELTSL